MKKDVGCSFCWGLSKNIGCLIRGSGYVFICRGCAEFCIKIFDSEAENEKWKKEQAEIKKQKTTQT